MLTTEDRSFITTEVNDLLFDTTRFRQRATFKSLYTEQFPDGTAKVEVVMRVQLFGVAADGGFGEPAQGSAVNHERDVALTADNDSAVDAATGQLVLMRSHTTTDQPDGTRTFARTWPEETPADFEARCQADPRDLTLQGDFFLTFLQQVLQPMIVANAQAAIPMNRYQ